MIITWKKISVVAGTLLAIASLVGVGFKIDAFYAHAEELVQLQDKLYFTNARLEQKIQEDRLYNLKERSWSLGDQIAKHPTPALIREKREVDHAIQMLEKELNKIVVKTKE